MYGKKNIEGGKLMEESLYSFENFSHEQALILCKSSTNCQRGNFKKLLV